MYNYSIKFINSQIYRKLAYLSIILITLSIFFPIRDVFLTKEAFLTGAYSDFTSFSLYLSDILLFVTWGVLILPRGKDFYHVVHPVRNPDNASTLFNTSKISYKYRLFSIFKGFLNGARPLKWLILAIFVSFIYHLMQYPIFSLYFIVKWLELIVAYGTFMILFEKYELKSLFLKLFVIFASFQSIFSLLQFYKQSSLGLFKLGESHLNPAILGVAKIVSHGTTYIRGYGTFPHPNPLSAILVVGILIGCYLYLKAGETKTRVGWGIAIILNIVGLATTFSRGAFISLLFGLLLFLGYCLFKREKGGGGLTLLVVTGIMLSIIIFRPYLLTRNNFSDQAILERKFYNQTGVQMALKNPILGVGAGESVLHMEQYSKKTLEPWEKQPPHNYFIVSASELGIPTMIILIWLFISFIYKLVRIIKAESDTRLLTFHFLLLTIMLCIILLMQFDHYFYTLEQIRLFLWISLALVSSETKTLPKKGSGDVL